MSCDMAAMGKKPDWMLLLVMAVVLTGVTRLACVGNGTQCVSEQASPGHHVSVLGHGTHTCDQACPEQRMGTRGHGNHSNNPAQTVDW